MEVNQREEKGLAALIDTMKRNRYADTDFLLATKAFRFAASAHSEQKRKSGEPYIIHPLATAIRLAEMRLDAETIAGGLLHDVCEDTEVTIDAIQKEFGPGIAFLVSGITKLDKIKYRGTERNAENLRKMFLAIAEDIRVVLIKLADRAHNMETLVHVSPEKRRRIALETLEIYAPLAYRLGIGEIKGRLEDLAFPYVYPQEYQWLMTHMQETFEDRKAYTARLIPEIKQEFKKERVIPIDIHARAKHYYSLYKKLLAHDMDIEKIYDLIAVRIVVETVDDCYRALGVIHKVWKPLPGRIKDYIAMPKPNGYRSLHTTIFGPEGKMTEVQIRTKEMHDEAENGIAAHWVYTEEKGGEARQQKGASPKLAHMAWVQQLREWQKNFQNPEEFVESLKIDFFKNRIFVFTPKGDVMDLPEKATPVDFAYQVHTAVGNTAVGAKVNGKMVALHHVLSSGDVIEILTQKNKKPSRDWLDFTKTAAARKKIAGVINKDREARAFMKPAGGNIELKLSVKDRIGLLKDISEVVARERINMKSVISDSRNRLYPLITIHIAVRSKPALEKLIVKLKSVNGVEEISYRVLP